MTNEQDTSGLDYIAGVAGLIGVVAAVVAAAAIWLMLTEPVTVANAVDTNQISPLVRRLAGVIFTTMVRLLDYL